MPSNSRIRLLLLTPHFGGGGAEHAIELLAAHLSPKKYELHLCSVTPSAGRAPKLPATVQIHELGASRVRAAALRLLRLVRRLRPDAVFSGMAHLNFLVLLLRPLFPRGTRVLVRQNGTASASLASDRLPVWTGPFYRLLYRRADRVVCQSQAMAEDLRREFGVPLERSIALPNPVEVEAIRTAVRNGPNLWTGPGPHLLAVGRLSPEKGFDLLLRAFLHLRERYPDAGLAIAGSGGEESALRDLARALHLEETVRFLGRVDRPAAYFPGASLFVLSSRHEGLPNALLEAAAGGLPIVATPASEGLVRLLEGQPGVWLAAEASVESLADSLLAALLALRAEAGSCRRFPHPFVEAFRIENAVRAYEESIDATVWERER
jgi:glycosyltransferase involved in cell wall biosynthesis